MINQPVLSIGQHSEAGRKEGNDDSYGVMIPDGPLLETKGIALAVADGVSVCDAAKAASESCVKCFLDDYYGTHESWSVRTSVGRILSALNHWLFGQGGSTAHSSMGMLSTFSGLILKSATAHVFHVGDSRIYHLRNGVMEQLTTDHRLKVSEGKDYLSRAMGGDLNVDIDCQSLSVEDGDIFVFTTDGVHDHVTAEEMSGFISDYSDNLDVAAQEIAKAAFDAGSLDNLTCQIVRVEKTGLKDEASHYRKLQELPFPPDLEPGNVLDGYRILRELYASNRSQVYLAVDTQTDETVAIKTPSVNYADDPQFLELFTREEWIGRRINSAHVLKVLVQSRRRQFLYYVTEYVEGQTLRQWMNDHPHPEMAEVRPIAEQIAAGLRAFHRQEMVHQDLKPENILIDTFGTVKIIDFGSAKIAGLEEIASPVDISHPLGTYGYTAPEYLTGEAGGNRSDIFSLGVIVYEMLTGALPYGEGFASRRDVEKRIYRSVLTTRSDLPPWVDAAFEKAVCKSPRRRYEALSEFLVDLSRPNPAFIQKSSAPLIERNPLGFWKGLALMLLVLNILLLTVLF